MNILTKHPQEFKITLLKGEFANISKYLKQDTNRLVYGCPLYSILGNIMLKKDDIIEVEIHDIFYVQNYEFNVVATIYKNFDLPSYPLLTLC